MRLFAVASLVLLSACGARQTYQPTYSTYSPSASSAPVAKADVPSVKPTTLTARQQATRLPVYRQAVADTMRDPSSTQFRGLKLYQNAKGEDVLCGSVNGKNAYGGYVGFDPFYAELVAASDFKKAVAVPFLASKVGFEYVSARCL